MKNTGTARPAWSRYGAAVLFPLMALGARVSLTPLLGEQSPLMLFILAGVVAAWWGGFWPGILSFTVGQALAIWIFIVPSRSWEIDSVTEWTRLALYVLVGVVVSALAEGLLRAKNRAEAASRAKDDFLATLSHELRTPLSPVLLEASVASTDSELSESERERWAMVQRNINLQARLVDDLLDLTRAARGKMSLRLEPLDAHGVLREAVALVSAEAHTKGQEMQLVLDAPRTRVEADAARLQQILWNVLKNAIKFTPDGGRICVTTSNPANNGQLRITIQDNGDGLSAAEIDRIFEAFVQGDHAQPRGAHRHGGLGLGLAISRELVTLHAGRIWAESAGKGQGASFYVELPVKGDSLKA